MFKYRLNIHFFKLKNILYFFEKSYKNEPDLQESNPRLEADSNRKL